VWSAVRMLNVFSGAGPRGWSTELAEQESAQRPQKSVLVVMSTLRYRGPSQPSRRRPDVFHATGSARQILCGHGCDAGIHPSSTVTAISVIAGDRGSSARSSATRRISVLADTPAMRSSPMRILAAADGASNPALPRSACMSTPPASGRGGSLSAAGTARRRSTWGELIVRHRSVLDQKRPV